MYKLISLSKYKGNYADQVLAAKNIRIELKDRFKGIKFSVKSSSYSMGNSIRIIWIDGPTDEQVQAVVNKYKQGDFDGMDDSYNYDKDRSFTDTYGGTKYVFTERKYSPSFVQTAITYLWHKFKIDAPKIEPEDFYQGRAYNIPVYSGEYTHHNNVQQFIHQTLRKVAAKY